MTPAGRVGLACAVVAATALLVVSATSDRWFHHHDDSPYTERETEWEGFGGPDEPYDSSTGLTGSDVVAATAGFCGLFALGLGLFVAFGTIVGRRRDHVPRLSALFGWSFAAGAEPEEAWLIRVETGDARELSMKVRDLEYRYPIDPGWVAALLSLRRRHTFTI